MTPPVPLARDCPDPSFARGVDGVLGAGRNHDVPAGQAMKELVPGLAVVTARLGRRLSLHEFSGSLEVGLARAVGEQSVVADPHKSALSYGPRDLGAPGTI